MVDYIQEQTTSAFANSMNSKGKVFFRATQRNTQTLTVKSGQVLKKMTFLESTAAGKVIAHSGAATKPIAGVLLLDVDASAW